MEEGRPKKEEGRLKMEEGRLKITNRGKDMNITEITVLLGLLSGRPDRAIYLPDFDQDWLVKFAMMHKVSYQLLQYAHKHPGFLSADLIEKLENKCRQTALVSLNQLQELIRITRRLREKGIAFAVIKGPQLARMLYGHEAMKESVDLDIMLMNQREFTRLHEVFTQLGYTSINLNSYKTAFRKKVFIIAKREVQYTSPAIQGHIDLHIKPGANTYLTARVFRNFFTDFEDYQLEGVDMPVPPVEKYLVYLCYHGSLHQFSRLAWLLDIRAFLQLMKDILDYTRLLAIARSLRTERSVFLALMLLQDYFGDEIPKPLKNYIKHTKRMNFLLSACRRMIGRDEGYGLSWCGRTGKLIYMMYLIRGFTGKVDLIYGICMRYIASGLKR
jgi:hypothetical protein